MKLPRRQFLHLAAGAAALPAVSRIARAQTYPTRPVRMIVGFAPGGGNDILARVIGQWLSERFGQQFIIENRPGAATNVATEIAVRAPGDGYTLLRNRTGNQRSVRARRWHVVDVAGLDKLACKGPVVLRGRQDGVMCHSTIEGSLNGGGRRGGERQQGSGNEQIFHGQPATVVEVA